MQFSIKINCLYNTVFIYCDYIHTQMTVFPLVLSTKIGSSRTVVFFNSDSVFCRFSSESEIVKSSPAFVSRTVRLVHRLLAFCNPLPIIDLRAIQRCSEEAKMFRENHNHCMKIYVGFNPKRSVNEASINKSKICRMQTIEMDILCS